MWCADGHGDVVRHLVRRQTGRVSQSESLTELVAGMSIVHAGNRVSRVSAELAANFQTGDRLIVVQSTGDLLHVPAADHALAATAVADARSAFDVLGACNDGQITAFFAGFADRLADDAVFEEIARANANDVADAETRGRSTTRLMLSESMRQSMIDGLRTWQATPGGRDRVVRTIAHDGWTVEERRAPLGVVGFVFEGRPNVFADATGVLRTGNTVVFRIGSDALRTARAIMAHAVEPALAAAGLPRGAVRLLDAAARATGWALFGDARLALAVARGSGPAVEQLGAVARQAGVPVSLHGTGGAWMIVGPSADAYRLRQVVIHSLDRKVCNTLNVCCIVAPSGGTAERLTPVVLDALRHAADRLGTPPRLHVVTGSEQFVPATWFDDIVQVARANGTQPEPMADVVAIDELATEWEWEQSPEMTLLIVDSMATAATLFNRYSPRFVASVISDDPADHMALWATLDAPFVGDGFTRWVDGQYALNEPELGLSNWQGGRLACRAGVLSGDSIHTLRLRVTQPDSSVHR